MEYIKYIILFLVSGFVFLGIEYIFRKKISGKNMVSAKDEAQKILEDAKREGESIRKENIVRAKEEIIKERSELEKEIRERRSELQSQERRLIQKEENLDRKISDIDRRHSDLDKRENEIEQIREETQKLKDQELDVLEQIAQMTAEEAKAEVIKRLDDDITHEKAVRILNLEEEIKEKSEDAAKNIISYAIQKCAADHTSEDTVAIVALPSDEMKGRIIGREGRNIKTLETLTGIDIIIGDTPEAVVISGFDPLRREVARIALEMLIDDGRIHPSKIEEFVEKAKVQLAKNIKTEGEKAAVEAGVINLHPEIMTLLGKLKYRTSYGQNVLMHSLEVSNLARIMAEELGLDADLAKRAGLLHDIGKALDHDMEGTHVELGVEVLKRHKENPKVINAVEAHHGAVECQTAEAVLVQAADAISASRPGARRETLEAYMKRLEKLEAIVNEFQFVEKSFAIQAGREIRIIVNPEKISEDKMTVLSREIAEKIENELDYPGEIMVNMIREKRVVDYAR